MHVPPGRDNDTSLQWVTHTNTAVGFVGQQKNSNKGLMADADEARPTPVETVFSHYTQLDSLRNSSVFVP